MPGVARLGTRFLQLLGPPRVEFIQTESVIKAGSDTQGSLHAKAPHFRSRRTVALLGYLAAEGRPISREFLAALLWPDEDSPKGRSNLRRELHNLTKILPDCWESDSNSVAFIPMERTFVDLYNVNQFKEQGRWLEAVKLLQGEFLEGIYLNGNLEFENWLLVERDKWVNISAEILSQVIDEEIQSGRYSAALAHTQRLLQLTPWNEKAHCQKMRLLAWTGQRGAALLQFKVCQQLLEEELGVEPALETVALYRQIHAGKLKIPPQLPAFLSEPSRQPATPPLFVDRELELERMLTTFRASLEGEGQIIFVAGGPGQGKTALMDAFRQEVFKAHPEVLIARGACNAYSGVGDPYLPFREIMAMLTGEVAAVWEAGLVSSAFAQRLWAAAPDILQILMEYTPDLLPIFIPGNALLTRAMAFEGGNPVWLPRLQEIVKRKRSSPSDVEQSYLFQQFTYMLSVVSVAKPLVLILDDMQWADNASIGLLCQIGRNLAKMRSRILILCAYRPEEITIGRSGERHPLEKPLNEFKRMFGDVWVNLDQIGPAEARRFVDALIDSEPNQFTDRFREVLVHRTGGNPLFTTELLRSMQERGDLYRDADKTWQEGSDLKLQSLPARVEAVIDERINRLDPQLQRILSVASVQGEVFAAQVVAEVLHIPEWLFIPRLPQELERKHRLVREEGSANSATTRISMYRFTHALFQDYLYQRLSNGEKRHYHGEVARAIEQYYPNQLEEMSAQLANHYLNAKIYAPAFRYFTIAAEKSAKIYAHEQAISHFSRALGLSAQVQPKDDELARIYLGRGRAWTILGNFDSARNDLETALQIIHSTNNPQGEWPILINLGKLWSSRNYTRAFEHFSQALELARDIGEPSMLAGSLNQMGNWYANDEYPVQAVGYHQEALQIINAHGDQSELANTLDLLGIANLLQGDYNASLTYYNQAIGLFRKLDNRPRLVSSLIGRGVISSFPILLAMVPVENPPDAHQDFSEATRLAAKIGSAPDEAWSLWALGLLEIVQGNFDRALPALRRGIQIAEEIKHREWLVGNLFGCGIYYNTLLAPKQAYQQLELALQVSSELRSQYWINHCTGAIATAHLLADEPLEAGRRLDTVLNPSTPMDTKGKRFCWAVRAKLALYQGQPDQALRIVDRLTSSAPGMLPGRVIPYLWKLRAEALAEMGQLPGAKTLLEEGLEQVRRRGERFLLWQILGSLSELNQKIGNRGEAEAVFSAAKAEIEALAQAIPEETTQQNFIQRALGSL
jgi:DNA-binding SARP family transcriptional activator